MLESVLNLCEMYDLTFLFFIYFVIDTLQTFSTVIIHAYNVIFTNMIVFKMLCLLQIGTVLNKHTTAYNITYLTIALHELVSQFEPLYYFKITAFKKFHFQ